MPVNIQHSDHLLLKIEILKAHGIDISTEKIDDTIRSPDKIEMGYKDRLVAQKRLDDKHVIRVIYEKQGETMLAITVYPGRRSRYEKD